MKRMLWIAPFAIVGLIAFAALGGAVVQALWNWLLPALFAWPAITFWQALGLLALCRILFGGVGFHRGRRAKCGPRMGQRWGHLSPQERDEMRERMRGRCGGRSPVSEPPTP